MFVGCRCVPLVSGSESINFFGIILPLRFAGPCGTVIGFWKHDSFWMLGFWGDGIRHIRIQTSSGNSSGGRGQHCILSCEFVFWRMRSVLGGVVAQVPMCVGSFMGSRFKLVVGPTLVLHLAVQLMDIIGGILLHGVLSPELDASSNHNDSEADWGVFCQRGGLRVEVHFYLVNITFILPLWVETRRTKKIISWLGGDFSFEASFGRYSEKNIPFWEMSEIFLFFSVREVLWEDAIQPNASFIIDEFLVETYGNIEVVDNMMEPLLLLLVQIKIMSEGAFETVLLSPCA
mmetsp:Transcript_8000/g.17388  ORF Transcript_8000/g.17388 Transcript_8000/m.17388 type:complete len:289 (-) Transcript_8000:605-1471(-)